ncbi:MAG TPA: hypothetical protein VKE42_07735, partial [Candidatus Cybelea sp.]|nr:hypothetical protein [Candidatus Cybelea sp.]
MLKFVQRVGAYHYFRKAGRKPVRLPGAEGSPEYQAAYDRELAKAEGRLVAPIAAVDASVAFIPGSVGWVIDQYLASNDFKDKAAGTQVAYAANLATLRAS